MRFSPRSWPIVLLLVTAGLLRAQVPTTQPTLLDVSQEKSAFDAAIGKEVIVQGTISSAAWSSTGKVMNIEFRDASKSRFLAVVFDRLRAKLDEGFGGDAAKVLMGSKVRIRGTLEPYGGAVESMKGRPQLIISVGDQITILELGSTQAGRASP